ncbi:MAG: ABC-2 transporter permease [Lachnospiraceae bacterium]|nr:ABC-2 transporter permease [Lachnospiraceae bacterium]
MAGLLYKDFIGINGKRIVWILIGATLLFLILRFVFPGNVDTVLGFGMVENEAGELVEMTVGDFSDSFLVIIPMILIASGIALPSTWTSAICRNDEKNKTRQFTRTLPLDKNAYIASKYIFIGIAVYVLFSLETVWIMIFNSVAGNNNCSELIAAISQLLIVFSGISILLASIELPFFLTLGVKKGSLLKIAILEGLAFLAIAYLFFGNLKVFENFDIIVFSDWCKEHLVVVALISIISPIVDIFIYWLSYRITCRINQNREVEIDG